jgi:hypothetical protein
MNRIREPGKDFKTSNRDVDLSAARGNGRQVRRSRKRLLTVTLGLAVMTEVK